MSQVLQEVDEEELSHVTLVRLSAGACLCGRLKKSARTVALQLLPTDRCLSQMKDTLAQGGVCVEQVLQPVGVFRSRFLTGLMWDWMPEGSLHSLLYETDVYPDLPVVLCLHLLLDVAEGLTALHAVSLTHGALKTSNILVDQQYRAKLCNWGQQTLKNTRNHVSILASEVLQGNVLCLASDMYSFGVLMWETLNRRPLCGGSRGVCAYLRHHACLRHKALYTVDRVPTHLRAHTHYRQFRDTNYPRKHVFGLWEETGENLPSTGRTCKFHTHNIDQLQNLVMCTQEGTGQVMEINLLPLETSQCHALIQLMRRCCSIDPKQRPLAGECVLELRKVLETLDSGALCTAVQMMRTYKERALLSSKNTPTLELQLDLNNLEGYGGWTGTKYKVSKTIPVIVPYSREHTSETHKSDGMILRESPPLQVSALTPCCRDTRISETCSNPDSRRCGRLKCPDTPNGSPTSPTHTPLHPANQPTVCPVSSGWTYGRLLQERREAIVHFMTEGRFNNLLDVLRARRVVTREDYEFITAAMTLSARTRCLLDTCACLGEKVSILVATTLGLVSVQASDGYGRSRMSPTGQVG